MTTAAGVRLPFLASGGEMGARIRAYDWSRHPFGPPERWPGELRAALSICLNSSFPTAIYWGPELRLLYNDAWAPIPAEKHPWALGRPAREVWPDIWHVIESQFAEVLRTGAGFSTFDQMLPMQRQGRVYETFWNYSLTPLKDEDGRVGGIFNQGHETTSRIMLERALRESEASLARSRDELEEQVRARTAELMRTEEQLRQSQKMDALGRLTGGIAHDFNNMLAVVISGLNLLERRLARGDTDVTRFIEGAKDGAQRAAALTQRLLAFSRQQPLRPKSLDANRRISGMRDILVRTLGERIAVETALGAGVWPLMADPSQLENAILNLAVNARDAMSGEGRLRIATANVALGEARAQAFNLPAGEYVEIAVSDTGAGIAPDILEKVFDPFFTTKPDGQGTGMGLSQVFGFVRQSGGHVAIDSAPGEGACVRMYLPRAYREPEEEAADGVVAPAEGSPDTTILVVEDDRRVLSFAADSLRDLGYSVVEAPGPGKALELIESGMRIDLVLTDIAMPEMSGDQLAERVGERSVDTKVVFMTGYANDAALGSSATLTLPKPFNIDQLAAAMRRALSERA